jgi:hypothetical protein
MSLRGIVAAGFSLRRSKTYLKERSYKLLTYPIPEREKELVINREF